MVGDVVCDEVCDVVGVVVDEVVGVVVGVKVAVVVGVDVSVVVGVVRMQSLNPPSAYDATAALRVAAVASQSVRSAR